MYKIQPVSKEKGNVNTPAMADILMSNDCIKMNDKLDIERIILSKFEKENLSHLDVFFTKSKLTYEKFTAEEYEQQDLFKFRNLQIHADSMTIIIEYLKLYIQDNLFAKLFNIEKIVFKRYGKRLKVDYLEISHNSKDFQDNIDEWRRRNARANKKKVLPTQMDTNA